MLEAQFDCPHCGLQFTAPARFHGKTFPCPDCGNLITVRVVTTEEAMRAGIMAGKIAALKALIFGRSD